MMIRWSWRTAATTGLLALAALARPAPAAAHCDSLDGPVVEAAREALAAGDPAPALVWVLADDEAEIRRAFARTLEVRRLGGEARELADLWFFETLVRVHREGEGAPYTGLKPAGTEPPAGIAAADRALESGRVEPLADRVGEHVAEALRERFERVTRLRPSDPADVAAGREWVHAYVEYIHFVEALHGLVEGGGAHGEGAGAGHAEARH